MTAPMRRSDAESVVEVCSSALWRIAYLADQKALLVQFRSGRAWRYERVPLDVFTALISAPSKGRFFNEHIRPAYRQSVISHEDVAAVFGEGGSSQPWLYVALSTMAGPDHLL